MSFMLLSLSNLILYEPLKNRWGKMRPGRSGPFVCGSVVGDSFPGEVFGVLQHTSARIGPVRHGWEYFTGTERKTALAISAICDSLIDSIHIAHLALNLSSLSRKVSGMVRDNICQYPSLLTKPSIETSCRRPKRSKKPYIKFKPFGSSHADIVPCCLIRGIPVSLKMALHSCGTQALGMVPAGEFGGKT